MWCHSILSCPAIFNGNYSNYVNDIYISIISVVCYGTVKWWLWQTRCVEHCLCLNIINFYTNKGFQRRDLVAQIYKSNSKHTQVYNTSIYIRFFIILLYSTNLFLYSEWTMNVKSHHAKKFIHNQLHEYRSVFIKMKISDRQYIYIYIQ